MARVNRRGRRQVDPVSPVYGECLSILAIISNVNTDIVEIQFNQPMVFLNGDGLSFLDDATPAPIASMAFVSPTLLQITLDDEPTGDFLTLTVPPGFNGIRATAGGHMCSGSYRAAISTVS